MHSTIPITLASSGLLWCFTFAVLVSVNFVVSMLFSGAVPLMILVDAQWRVPEAVTARTALERIGALMVAAAVAILPVTALVVLSGFVRGRARIALAEIGAIVVAIVTLQAVRQERRA